MSQPQLLKIPLVPTDVVYTPDWVARDMVEFFKPTGIVLDPCKGDGAFTQYLPGCQWCEIEAGRDFFAYHKKVDWIIGNPPYKIFGDWFMHSVEIASNICYLMPIHFFFRRGSILYYVMDNFGIVHMRLYGNGSQLGFPMGNPIAALHFQKGYHGPMYSSRAALPSNSACT